MPSAEITAYKPNANGHWKTMAIRHGHDLGSFAAFGFLPTFKPLFRRRKARIDESLAHVDSTS
jgi:hypothetical protein